MRIFIVGNAQTSNSECSSCCCSEVYSAPGESDSWNLDFGAWAIPIGGKGLSETAVNVEKLRTPPSTGVVPKFIANETDLNTPFVGTAAASFDIDAGIQVKYGKLPFDGPKYGTVTVDPDTGDMTYTPLNGYAGWDRFFLTASQENGKMTISEVAIGVKPTVGVLPSVAPTPDILIPEKGITLLRNIYTVKMIVAVSPAVRPGSIYRITVQQTALDCDCNELRNISCYDLTVGKC